MPTPDHPFPPYHRLDRGFFLTMAAIAWIGTLGGFIPELYDHAKGASAFPGPIILIHGGVFFGWLGLFTLQVWLVKSRRTALHRRLGLSAVGLLPLMVILGLEANVAAQRRHFLQGELQLNFMIVPITDMIVFGILGAAALLFRKKPATHKRLFLLATLSLLDAGLERWVSPWFLAHAGDGFFGFMTQIYLVFDLVIVGAMIYDQSTRGRIHPAYLIAFPPMLAGQCISSAIYHAPGWIPIARSLIS